MLDKPGTLSVMSHFINLSYRKGNCLGICTCALIKGQIFSEETYDPNHASTDRMRELPHGPYSYFRWLDAFKLPE